MGSDKGTLTHCTGCGNQFFVALRSRVTGYCEECVHAEEVEPVCTCLVQVELLGWAHALACPRNPASRRPAFAWGHR